MNLTAAVDIRARSSEPNDTADVEIVAYGGGIMRVAGFGPVAIDLAGVGIPPQVPLLADHNSSVAGVLGEGHARVEGGRLLIAGAIVREAPAAGVVLAMARAGHAWQASIGLDPTETKFLRAGETITLNGQALKAGADGLTIVTAGRLREVSVVAIGADSTTTAAIAASAEPADISAAMQLGAEQERNRLAQIDQILAGLPADAASLRAEAVAGTIDIPTLTKKALAMLRSSRATVPAIFSSGGEVDFAAQSEAAILLAIGRRDLAAKMGERVVESANRAFHGDGLGAVVRATLERNGTLRPNDTAHQRLRAAFSSSDISNILSSVAGKVLLSEYRQLPATWRSFAAVRSTPDLKDASLLRTVLTGTLDELPPNGEMKQGKISDEKINVSIGTFAKLLSVPRRDLINDDLGALQTLPGSLARMAMRSLNDAVWAKIIAGAATHFTAPRGNYISGAGTALSATSLQQAVSLFRMQKDAAGNNLDLAPAVLVVPGALEFTGRSILTSTEIRDTTASTRYGTSNPVADLGLKLEIEPRLDADSVTAWYLFGPPVDSPLAVLFLNGVDAPTVETSDADFDTLGIQMRVYHDWGVSLGDPKSAAKSKGAA